MGVQVPPSAPNFLKVYRSMIIALTVLHVIVCFFLIIVVLLQSGKGADVASAFTGMGSQTAFGPRGAATVFSRLTAGAVVVFMLTSLTLALISSRRGSTAGSVLENEKPAQTQPAPPPPAPQQQQQPAAPATQPK
jgi:preprotein translocase subunit SecG